MHYLSLSENIAHETVRQGDTRFLICDIQDIPEDSEARYFDKTKWSDFNVGIPILFVAYHGFELLLKGFLIQA